MRPRWRIAARWQIEAAAARSWVMNRIVRPLWRFSERNRSRIAAALITSSALVASSAISSFG